MGELGAITSLEGVAHKVEDYVVCCRGTMQCMLLWGLFCIAFPIFPPQLSIFLLKDHPPELSTGFARLFNYIALQIPRSD